MLVPICVVLGLLTDQNALAEAGALASGNRWITDGLSDGWNTVCQVFHHGDLVDCICVRDKVEDE